MKERSVIENDYAKRLKKLVKDFSLGDQRTTKEVGGGVRHSRNSDTEYSHMKAYKQMLLEVGIIAGQHELLSESLIKDNLKPIREQAKKFREIRRCNMDAHKKHVVELNKVYLPMEKTKEKFRKSFEDQEKAVAAHQSASSVTKSELNKLNMQRQNKTSQCDAMKGEYANQLIKVNDAQNNFYGQLLPNVLNELRKMEESRIALMKQSVKAMITKEREMAVIVTKCVDAMEKAVDDVVPKSDTALVIEHYKTGDVPLSNFNFENVDNCQALLSQDAIEESKASKLNLYPEKRELQSQIQAANEDLVKKRLELEALQKMLETCAMDPQYGKNPYEPEVNEVTVQVQNMECQIKSLTEKHAQIDSRLQELQNRFSKFRSTISGLCCGWWCWRWRVAVSGGGK